MSERRKPSPMHELENALTSWIDVRILCSNGCGASVKIYLGALYQFRDNNLMRTLVSAGWACAHNVTAYGYRWVCPACPPPDTAAVADLTWLGLS